MEIWSDQILKQDVLSHTSSVLLLDDCICHNQTPFLETMEEISTNSELIPGGFTCVIQACDVGIMKSLMSGVRHQYTDLASKKLSDMASRNILPMLD